MQKTLKKMFDVNSTVIYPPVQADFPAVPFDRRENGFVFIGRIAPEKRIEDIVTILAAVRERENVHLHIAGPLDDSAYCKEIRSLAGMHADWMRLDGVVFGEAKRQLLARHKYGINACQGEAFGISVAEFVKVGCIVFVPDNGGQTEIVDHQQLTYRDADEAVSRILGVLRSEPRQRELLGHLLLQAEKFSVQRFRTQARCLVDRLVPSHARRGWPARVRQR